MAPPEQGPNLVYQKMGDIKLYGVTHDELEAFRSSSSADEVTFATACISIFVSLLASLVGGTFTPAWSTILAGITAASFGLGAYFLVKGSRAKRSTAVLVERILQRHPTEPATPQLPEPGDTKGGPT